MLNEWHGSEGIDRKMEGHSSALPRLLVLIGPTAVGKTKLSIEIAKRWNAEIVSGDSMQVYRGMDVGTAKIMPDEMEGVPHHLIDICDPTDSFSAADFQQLAKQTIAEIDARGRLPFLVGGTGLYVESLCYSYAFSEGGSDDAFRDEMRRFMEQHGVQALHDKLRQIDPQSAERLHPNDHRRVIRALEVAHLTGMTMSEHLAGQMKQPAYQLCLIGLTMDRQILYNRIEARIDLMLEQGLVEEVDRLLRSGCTMQHVSMQGLGYKEIAGALLGHYSMAEAVRLLKRDTRHFAKRQLSWFRHMSDIQWVDVSDSANFSAHLQTINGILAGKFTSDREYK